MRFQVSASGGPKTMNATLWGGLHPASHWVTVKWQSDVAVLYANVDRGSWAAALSACGMRHRAFGWWQLQWGYLSRHWVTPCAAGPFPWACEGPVHCFLLCCDPSTRQRQEDCSEFEASLGSPVSLRGPAGGAPSGWTGCCLCQMQTRGCLAGVHSPASSPTFPSFLFRADSHEEFP